jgi:hypothetical protein
MTVTALATKRPAGPLPRLVQRLRLCSHDFYKVPWLALLDRPRGGRGRIA